MTPFASLLVLPTDDDDRIRCAYHALSRLHHPDRAGGAPGPRWYEIAAAYAAVKTVAARARWAWEMELAAGSCPACAGYGVQGSRITKVRLCPACGGEGKEKR
jgi:DnaJ-class molecular chaperone